MYVDPRVAHGRARCDLARNPRMLPAERVAEVYALLRLFAASYGQQGASPREMRRYLESRTIPKVRSYGFSPWLGGECLYVWALGRSAEEGIVHQRLYYSIKSCHVGCIERNAIETHAVARCMQRLGKERVQDIEPVVRAVIAALPPLIAHAYRNRWKQIAVPTSVGLFAGSVSPSGDVELKTFFCPGENGQPSRWLSYMERFSGIPSWEDGGEDPGATIATFVERSIADEAGRTLTNMCPFLLSPYERRSDPLTERWSAATAATGTSPKRDRCVSRSSVEESREEIGDTK